MALRRRRGPAALHWFLILQTPGAYYVPSSLSKSFSALDISKGTGDTLTVPSKKPSNGSRCFYNKDQGLRDMALRSLPSAYLPLLVSAFPPPLLQAP